MFFLKFEPPWEVPMAPSALFICILWPGGGALRAYDFVIVDDGLWQTVPWYCGTKSWLRHEGIPHTSGPWDHGNFFE